ncbi:hypothetical protein BV898_05653 [Hypsibius exemplaris]|uniref:Ig-like domain-containing protein n=1 Tax=Hypsibius exemplaris TaxID=2072580 RepID=A0A1W0WYT8_HYPEX|nr:hypothetical protein BV898_05653 [Hypsibius exemplaris]
MTEQSIDPAEAVSFENLHAAFLSLNHRAHQAQGTPARITRHFFSFLVGFSLSPPPACLEPEQVIVPRFPVSRRLEEIRTSLPAFFVSEMGSAKFSSSLRVVLLIGTVMAIFSVGGVQSAAILSSVFDSGNSWDVRAQSDGTETMNCRLAVCPARRGVWQYLNGTDVTTAGSGNETRQKAETLIYGPPTGHEVFTCVVEDCNGAERKENFTVFEKVTLKDITPSYVVNEGASWDMECPVNGWDKINKTWFFGNGTAVPHDHRYSIAVDPPGATVSFRNLTASQSGNYTCRVHQTIDAASNYTHVISRTIELVVQHAPYFLTEAVTLPVTAGSAVKLPCDAVAVPSATFNWKSTDPKTGQMMMTAFVSKDLGHEATLELNVTASDFGTVYECAAQNMLGTAKKTFTLIKSNGTPTDSPHPTVAADAKLSKVEDKDGSLSAAAGISPVWSVLAVAVFVARR